MSYQEIMTNKDILSVITENSNENLSGVRSYGYPSYTVGKFLAHETPGSVCREEITVYLPGSEDTDPEAKDEGRPQQKVITNTSQIQCTGNFST